MQTKERTRASVAVVDDEPYILEAWQAVLGEVYDVRVFADALAAKSYFATHEVDVALLDVKMPGIDGLSLLAELKQVQPLAEAIVITGHGSIQLAVEAIRQGAYDFLCKPIEDAEVILRRIAAALERRRLRQTNAELRQRLAAFDAQTEIIGTSRAVGKIREMITQIADSTAPVLICGESGTGKELVARALHTQSGRREKPFLALNCGAVTETLIDSELFGHERGAFTGATSAHAGLFAGANGGVLFLDEVGDLPAQTQVRLLRAIQEGEIRPVGSNRSQKVDVRVVAATNVNLERAMAAGKFRDDLYYRISTFRIDMPALRERAEDIPLIAQHLLGVIARRNSRAVDAFADEALAALVGYDWPGNVRELANAIEHAVTLCRGEAIQAAELPSHVKTRTRRSKAPAADGSAVSVPYSEARARLIDEFERRYLTELFGASGGNLSEAARRSGIDRANLRRLVRRHNLRPEEFKSPV